MDEKYKAVFEELLNRQPTEGDEELYSLFLPDGDIGKWGKSYKTFSTDDAEAFGFFSSYMENNPLSDGTFCAAGFNPFFMFSGKSVYFRPTDEIFLLEDMFVPSKSTKKAFGYYSPSLYALVKSCKSIALELGGSEKIESLAGKSFFVFPSDSKKAKKLAQNSVNLRKIGVVTSDGVIRVFVNGAEVSIAALPKAVIPPVVAGESLEMDDSGRADYILGYIHAFSDLLGAVSSFDFPFEKPTCPGSANTALYRLGYVVGSALLTAAKLPKAKKIKPDFDSGDYNAFFIPYEPETMSSLTQYSAVILYQILGNPALRKRNRSLSGFAAAVCRVPFGENTLGKYTVENLPPAETANGVVVIAKDFPRGVNLGALIKKQPPPDFGDGKPRETVAGA